MYVQNYDFGYDGHNFPGPILQNIPPAPRRKTACPAQSQATLTRREAFIMDLVMQGYTNRRIAERSFISVNTVKFHMKNIFVKLGATTRTHAVQLYADR